jgi:hypothetical protein
MKRFAFKHDLKEYESVQVAIKVFLEHHKGSVINASKHELQNRGERPPHTRMRMKAALSRGSMPLVYPFFM